MSTPKTKANATCDLRRQEVRRQRGEASGTLWQRLSRSVSPRILLTWCAFYVSVVAILLAGRESMPWHLGQRVSQDVSARVPFSVEVTLQTKANRESAKAKVPAFYIPNIVPLNDIQTEMREWGRLATEEPRQFFENTAAKGLAFKDPARLAIRRYMEDLANPNAWDGVVQRLIDQLKAEYLVDTIGEGEMHELRRPDETPIGVPRERLVVADAAHITALADRVTAAVFPEPETLRSSVKELIVRTLSGAGEKKLGPIPLWRYDVASTVEAQRRAIDQVQPVYREIKTGDTLAAANKQLSIEDLTLLKEEHAAFLKAQRDDPAERRKMLLHQAGIAAIALLVTLGLAAYAATYEARLFRKFTRNLWLSVLILVMVGLGRLIEMAEWPYDLPVEFSVGVVTIAAALMTIAFGQRFSFGGSGAVCMLVALACRGEFSLLVALLTAVGLTIFLLREIRTRSKVVWVGSVVGLGAAFASLAALFMEGEPFGYAVPHAACAGLAAVVAGLVVQGILPHFERAFGIATSMTLLEWCDASRPLLRLLAQNAPGTYSHSLILSQMAEEAAAAIGARGLLARVGALYHDVGKAAKPEYFVENQEARINRHDRLSPTMSLLIIVGHVKDGIEMARAYGLPKLLHQFILEHHGTTVVRYFHRVAVDAEASGKSKRFCDRDVPESEFRYPGPKPSSKESAILMLCDGCESAVRAVAEPTPGRIEGVVHQVVMDRLNDGQFDDCDITLRELRMVELSLVKSLGAIHHMRVRYPDKATPASAREENGSEAPAAAEEPVRPPTSRRPPQPSAEVVRQS